jgi:hypothetical protein
MVHADGPHAAPRPTGEQILVDLSTPHEGGRRERLNYSQASSEGRCSELRLSH